jgi:hypothetical protein
LAIVQRRAGTPPDVIDPWISDTRRVRELPLRVHEEQAVQAAVRQHGL